MYADPETQRRYEERLRGIEATRAALAESLAEYQKQRDEAIREAVLDAKLTQAQVARATNLTRSRVGQILEEQ